MNGNLEQNNQGDWRAEGLERAERQYVECYNNRWKSSREAAKKIISRYLSAEPFDATASAGDGYLTIQLGSILGMSINDIARLKSWFENQTGKGVGEFWEQAFNAGMRQALLTTADGISWHPIDTAPKDGRRLLLAWDYDDIIVVGYYGDVRTREVGSAHRKGMASWRASWDEYPICDSPTHWMPLLKPPIA